MRNHQEGKGYGSRVKKSEDEDPQGIQMKNLTAALEKKIRLKSLPALVISSQIEASALKGTATKNLAAICGHAAGPVIWRCTQCIAHPENISHFSVALLAPWTHTQNSFGYLW